MPKIKNPTYGSFLSMKKRCYEKNNRNYKYYGGRGITVCDRWKLYKNFLADMGERPIGKTLDRINVDKGYFKDNCRWATPKEQADNRRPYKCSITYNGVTKSIEDWAKDAGLNMWTFKDRIKRYGWSIERALNTPTMPKGNPNFIRKTGGIDCGLQPL